MTDLVASCVIINKNERAVTQTLEALDVEIAAFGQPAEIVVIDASGGQLNDIYRMHDSVRLVPFEPPPGVAVTIPHQRNRGIEAAASDHIVFVDAGCTPRPGWLGKLVAAIGDDAAAAGRTVARGHNVNNYQMRTDGAGYVTECPTINLAFRRDVALAIGGFDEGFEYGSDVDFSWRLIDAGHRIRHEPEAVVETDWGTWRRQLKRSLVYGRARARLYRKHREKRREILRRDPVALIYPLYILGLPLAWRHPWYLLLLTIPLWRNRRSGGAVSTLDHLVYGVGVLDEMRVWMKQAFASALLDGRSVE